MLFATCLSVWHNFFTKEKPSRLCQCRYPMTNFFIRCIFNIYVWHFNFSLCNLTMRGMLSHDFGLHWYGPPSLSVSSLNTDSQIYWSFSCNDCLASSRLNLTFLAVHTYVIIKITCGVRNSTMYLYIVMCRFLFLFVCVFWEIVWKVWESGILERDGFHYHRRRSNIYNLWDWKYNVFT